jgi:hypothetical protein
VGTDARFFLYSSFLVRAGAVRSVHGYKVIGRKAGVGWVRWEKWVERGFFLSADRSTELIVPDDAPRILQAWCSGRPAFREGHTVGHWRCIVAFDNVAAVKPSAPPPPMLCPTGYVLSIASDRKRLL